MIKWGAQTGILVSGGATLCLVNAVLDGQQQARAVLGTGTGTTMRFIDVTFQNCAAHVKRPFGTCCLANLNFVCNYCPKRAMAVLCAGWCTWGSSYSTCRRNDEGQPHKVQGQPGIGWPTSAAIAAIDCVAYV